MSQGLSYISKVIVARRCQTGSRLLTGAAHPAHSSDVLKQCLQSSLLHCLPGDVGPPELSCVHGVPTALASPCLRVGAFQWQRLGVLRTLSQPRRQGSASGRHSCCHAVRVVTLAAKISFLVGRFSFPVPLLAFFFFFASPFLVTASSCLLGQQLACLLAAFHLPLCKRALCSVTSHQPALSQTPGFPAYNPCWPTLRSAAALGSSQHFTVAACLCCVSGASLPP